MKGTSLRIHRAAQVIKATRAWEGFGRRLDWCFESGDGDDVWRGLLTLALADADLLTALRLHWPQDVLDRDLAELTATPLFDSVA